MLQAGLLFLVMASASGVPTQELGIVVARFKEPLEPWAPLASNTYLYSKGGIGQENYTDVMIFTQASPFDLTGPVVNNSNEMVAAAMQVPVDDVTPFNKQKLIRDKDDWEETNWTASEEKPWMTENQLKTLARANYTPAEFWRFVLEEEHPPAIRAMHGGIFAVRRETVQSRPVEVHQRALQRFEEAIATNPEVGFYWERTWAPVFSKRYWTYHPINESSDPFRK
ncbi:hypothetical protein INS49_015377 [Diaporthe citri]|uniref:uncharacterized protein n=1 Tax=Diaporthe citri TaxID=83186 RepID=UPI001C7F69B1|nr:uncharacterized protein INS49_015377 [Diaporthe citri]KAG6355992.1 hypothetical protein INS49_015377 [Diaporthe citri]